MIDVLAMRSVWSTDQVGVCIEDMWKHKQKMDKFVVCVKADLGSVFSGPDVISTNLAAAVAEDKAIEKRRKLVTLESKFQRGINGFVVVG